MDTSTFRKLNATVLTVLFFTAGSVAVDTATAQNTANAYNLIDLYRIALEKDARLKAAEHAYEAGRLDHPIARADLLPQLGLSAARRRQLRQDISGNFFGQESFDEVYNTDQLQLNLTQTLFNMGQFIALSQSKSKVEAARLRYEAERQNLIVRLAQAYFDVLTAASLLESTRSEKKAVEQQRQQATQRFEAGLAAVTDVKEAQAAYDLATAEEISAGNSLQSSLHALSVLVAADVNELKHLDAGFVANTPEPNDIAQWSKAAVAGNPELLEQKMHLSVARQAVESESSEHYPSLNLYATRNETDTRGGPSPSDTETLQVGVEMNLPLFTGGKTYYRTKQAAQKHQQEQAKLEQMQREVKQRAREAFLNVVTNLSRIKALERARESARAAVDSNRQGFNLGTRTSVDVLLAMKDLFRTSHDYKTAQHTYIMNTLQLKQTTGTLLEDDLIRINARLTQTSPSL